MENQDRLVDLLNNLIIINNDRVEGYENASSSVKDLALKGLFEAMARDSRTFGSELAIEIAQMGGKISTGTSTAGDIYRVWMAIKATLTKGDQVAILNSCEEGEKVAQAAYDSALNAAIDIPNSIRHLLLEQKTKLKEAHNAVVKLRDTVYSPA